MSIRESRHHPRIPAQLAVRFHGGHDLRAAFISSVSQGGVFIKSAHRLPIARNVREIEIEGSRPDQAKGTVIWERWRA